MDENPSLDSNSVQQTNNPAGVLLSDSKSPHHKNTKWLIVILLVVIILLFSGGIFAFFKSKQTITNKLVITNLPTSTSFPIPSVLPSVQLPPTDIATSDWKIYKDTENRFEFKYPESWIITTNPDKSVSIENDTNNLLLTVNVWRVTGFGYCYKYLNKKTILIDGVESETADGVGGTEMCSDTTKDYTKLGNSYVLIPLKEKPNNLPTNYIHLSYDYPLSTKDLSLATFNQILSTFRFFLGKETKICPEGFVLYDAKDLSICHPRRYFFENNNINSDESYILVFGNKSNNEKFAIFKNITGGTTSGGECLVKDKIVISNYQAERWIRRQSLSSSCKDIIMISSFINSIDKLNNYAISLYGGLNINFNEYIIIEQSLIIK